MHTLTTIASSRRPRTSRTSRVSCGRPTPSCTSSGNSLLSITLPPKRSSWSEERDDMDCRCERDARFVESCRFSRVREGILERISNGRSVALIVDWKNIERGWENTERSCSKCSIVMSLYEPARNPKNVPFSWICSSKGLLVTLSQSLQTSRRLSNSSPKYSSTEHCSSRGSNENFMAFALLGVESEEKVSFACWRKIWRSLFSKRPHLF